MNYKVILIVGFSAFLLGSLNPYNPKDKHPFKQQAIELFTKPLERGTGR